MNYSWIVIEEDICLFPSMLIYRFFATICIKSFFNKAIPKMFMISDLF